MCAGLQIYAMARGNKSLIRESKEENNAGRKANNSDTLLCFKNEVLIGSN